MRAALIALLILSAAVGAVAHPGSAIALGRDGRVYFVDTGGGIFVIGKDGSLNRIEGPAFHWFAIDVSSRLASTPWPTIRNGELRSVGRDPTIILSSDFPVTVGRDGALYYAELVSGKQFQIIRVIPTGSRSVHATLPIEMRAGGEVGWVNGLATAADGSLFYTQDRIVRKVSSRGIVSTVAENVSVPKCVTIPGIEPAGQPYLRGLDVAPDGTIFVAAAGCSAVLKITPAGQVTPILRAASPYSPTAVATSNGEVYVLEYLHTASDNRREWLPRVRKIGRNGGVTTLVNVKSR